ncbi:hypothetical protein F2P81_002238 [Scophthalmus maximus]|uniref:Integral membrane protein GPR137C n=1 Tax=Scophthalmus maximus TaxID=52904 RepID=A0A6A4TLJ2_SCOMX|nr:hypothetical protein F2P81_002238 [Scophthalmus maximus]
MSSAGAGVHSQLFTSPNETPGAAISPTLELGLTAVCTVLYSSLFAVVYLQLWLILHYGHKRCSYQSVFLFLCLLWAALRTTLFSFYFKNVAHANQLQPLAYWLLYCCPVCLQFFIFCLLNLYFTQVIFKAKAKYSPELAKYKVLLRLFFLCLSIFFLVVNLTCALLMQGALEHSESPSDEDIRHAVLARVLINDSLFVLCAISLAVCIFKIAKMSPANVYLESKGTSVCQAIAIGAVVILLYTSRACYNLAVVALSPHGRPSPFNCGWYTVSDQIGASSWYGSIQCNGALAVGGASALQPPSSTAPVLLAYGDIQSHRHLHHLHHHNYYSTPQNNNNYHHNNNHHSNYYSTPQHYYCGPQTYFCNPQS